ncbi:hypothetical protein ABFB09_03085 [Dehalogenimonas sp. THU2]|uniref:glycine zipper family protein n=1 Tax=Dehalogenimonas sp. THU2 TaxID=3151121 RepID=UPI0032185CBD
MADTNAPNAALEAKIQSLRDGLSPKEQKRLRLDMVLQVIRRLEALSADCDFCAGHPQITDQLTEALNSFDREKWRIDDWKTYYRLIDNTVKHLKEAHQLVEEGENMGMWIALGTGIGVALGAAFDNVGAGIVIGIAIGTAFGASLDAVAHKQGKVI